MNKDFEIAEKVRSFSCSQYSKYTVGAALRTKGGKVYTGCNIENDGIQSICAERTAFVKALSEGEREFESITILGGPAGEKATDKCVPCGYCRQFMSEYVDKDFKIYTKQGDEVRAYKIDELLPNCFRF